MLIWLCWLSADNCTCVYVVTLKPKLLLGPPRYGCRNMPFGSRSEREVLNNLFDELFPITRSITGPGLRKSLEILSSEIPLDIQAVSSGTNVFDWEIPDEWHIYDAYLEGPDGQRYADFNESNLYVVNYSKPIDKSLPLSELKKHIYTNENVPDAIPYVTSYYNREWGFCLPHRVYDNLPDGEYHAYIDSEFTDGNLYYGHTTLEGESDEEMLITSYLCHPSMANNELSGPLVLSSLYSRIQEWETRYYTYRFVLAPETIGSLAYLSKHGDKLNQRLISGAVLTCLGGPKNKLSYQFSRQGDSLLDEVIRNINDNSTMNFHTRPFTPTGGSDERQYCSPGFDLPVGQFARTVYGEYDGYHNSNDDKEFMTIDALVDSSNRLEEVFRSLEYSGSFLNTKPYGEPKLDNHNLYPSTNAPETWNDSTDNIVNDDSQLLNAVLRILNYSDGEHRMVDIASSHNYAVQELIPVIERLQEENLLRRNYDDETV